MASYSQMSHPLAGRPAASQRKRRRPSLDPASAPIDGRVMADFLVFLEKYARQVNFWEVQQDEFTREGYLSAADWSVFFQKSLPFALARLAKTDITDLNLQVFNLLRICRDEPEAANFQILLDFIFEEILQPFVRLDQASRDGGLADFTLFLNGKLAAGLQQPVQFFQKTGLAGQLSVCINPPDFQPFLQNSAWGFANETALLLTADERTALPITNQNEFIRSQAASLEEPLRQMLVLFGEIAAEAPRHLDRALLPLEKAFQENHEPHLGLVFAFLELFKQVQGDLNKLTARHLEFFYEKVLRFVPREAVPDRAHLVFEISKHLDRHKVAAGTLVKDGKDDRKADILFALDEEIILDKTSIAEVRTLFLNKKMVGPRAFIESLHMAPNALKADGLEKDFPEGEPKNWATLGDRPSKWLKPASLPKEMVDYPVAPLGLALSSPVLLLQEGDRTVTVSLKLKNRGDLSLADFATKVVLPISSALLAAPLFLVDFSGKDGWLKPKADPTFTFSTTAASGIIPEKLKIDLIIKLAPDEKAVVFFDKEKLKADYRLQTPYPTLRLRFNPDLELEMPLQNLATDPCEQLKNPLPTGPHFASPYEWLKDTDLEDINISVVVNGVKNLLVSNDESTQNVNSQMLPFGARPTNGDHFYIGSKEVFCKNWSSVDVHTEWKDLPLIFDQHYAAYTGTLFGSNLIPIERADFQLKAEALDQANWQAVNLSNPFLFPLPTPDPVNDPLTTDVAASENQLWHIDRGALSYFPFSMPLEELPNRSVESQKGFVSLKLQGSDMDVFRRWRSRGRFPI